MVYLVPLPNISNFTSFFSYVLDILMSCRVGQNNNLLLITWENEKKHVDEKSTTFRLWKTIGSIAMDLIMTIRYILKVENFAGTKFHGFREFEVDL